MQHVVAFNFEHFVKHESLIPKLFDFINNFSIKFYKGLLSDMKVNTSFEESYSAYFDELCFIQTKYEQFENL